VFGKIAPYVAAHRAHEPDMSRSGPGVLSEIDRGADSKFVVRRPDELGTLDE
jgi:hypothetical protein